MQRVPFPKLVIGAFALFAMLMFYTGWILGSRTTLTRASLNAVQPVRYKDPEFPLINPLISVAIPNATGFNELTHTKKDVEQIIQKAKARGDATEVGVYFRLPTNAHWFGIDEDDKFDPGSLLKVPIMLAYLKEAEQKPAILEKRFRYVPEVDSALPNSLPPQLKAGSYSARRLLEAMIIDSDNVAKDILTSNISEKALQDVFDETNSTFLEDPAGTISPKQYIIMLSRIYSATYLDRQYSNYAMELLAKAKFKDGLVAGLPESVPVAHKYGERGMYVDNTLVGIELHDCGLIFAETPYYLCIMTKGKEINALSRLIKNISATVYADRESFKLAE